jgi:hypothetical protein
VPFLPCTQVQRLKSKQARGNAPTEETWRSYVYADSERIFFQDPELDVEWYVLDPSIEVANAAHKGQH